MNHVGDRYPLHHVHFFLNVWTLLWDILLSLMAESNTSASYLDLLLSIGRDGQLHTSIYDKR